MYMPCATEVAGLAARAYRKLTFKQSSDLASTPDSSSQGASVDIDMSKLFTQLWSVFSSNPNHYLERV
ncbi:hypothetical protein TMatcc_010269 [Talaromyces marneffei ATCC 18224]